MMSTQSDPPALHAITLGQCGGPDPSLVIAAESEVAVKNGGQQWMRKCERWLSPSGHGVVLIPIRVLYSYASPVGTAEDLSSQTTKSKYHVIGQVIRVTCKVM
jgi:hypothetical protein